jgi:acyl-CoA synthetase (NDP forming)
VKPDDLNAWLAAVVRRARAAGRSVLLEGEGLAIARRLGIAVPEATTVRDAAEAARRDDYLAFAGSRLVLKVVSPGLAHKTEVGGIRFVAKTRRAVVAAIEEMRARLDGVGIEGYAIQRFVEHDPALGGELLLGLRHTDAFGPVVVVGPGGVLAEFLHGHLAPGRGAVAVSAAPLAPERLRATLEQTAIVRLATGAVRGQPVRIAPWSLVDLVRRFQRFAGVASDVGLGEFEINPLALTREGPVALDALARIAGPAAAPAPPRPLDKLERLLRPRTVAVVGVSDRANPGRLILENLLAEGFPPERIVVVKPGADTIAGCRCVPDIEGLPEPVDLIVLSVAARAIPAAVESVIAGNRAESLIVIPGGMGERGGTERIARHVRTALDSARRDPSGGPLLNGGNCLGVRSVPGRLDTLFIPRHKLPRPTCPASPLAIVSQSGAFAVAALSKLAGLNPRYVITIGNQLDLTAGDCLSALGDDPEIAVYAFYLEGFRPMDGARWIEAADHAAEAGKTVILYRAGRTPEGLRAGAAHTAALASGHEVAGDLARAAGVLVADALEDFVDLTLASCAWLERTPPGPRVGAISNAGFECVAMADNLGALELARFGPATQRGLELLLARHRLDGIVAAGNPFDATPILDDAAFAEAVRLVLDDDGVDVVIAGCVPLTGALETLPAGPGHEEDISREDSVVSRLVGLARRSRKPLAAVVDAGPLFDAMLHELRRCGVPTFRTVDRALRIVGALEQAARGRARSTHGLSGIGRAR